MNNDNLVRKQQWWRSVDGKCLMSIYVLLN
jgi:hypothetical protein